MQHNLQNEADIVFRMNKVLEDVGNQDLQFFISSWMLFFHCFFGNAHCSLAVSVRQKLMRASHACNYGLHLSLNRQRKLISCYELHNNSFLYLNLQGFADIEVDLENKMKAVSQTIIESRAAVRKLSAYRDLGLLFQPLNLRKTVSCMKPDALVL